MSDRFQVLAGAAVVATLAGGALNTLVPGAMFTASIVVLVLVACIPFALPSRRDPEDEAVLDSALDLVTPTTGALPLAAAIFAIPASVPGVDNPPVDTHPPAVRLIVAAFGIPGLVATLLVAAVALVGFAAAQSRAKTRKSTAWAILIGVALLPLLGLYAVVKRYLSALDPVVFWFHMAVILATLLSTFLVFSAAMIETGRAIQQLNQQPILLLALPAGLGLGDLLTVVQGFGGLRTHFPFFAHVSLVGIAMAVASTLLLVVFYSKAQGGRLTKRSVAHYVLSLAFALSVGSVVMFGMAELLGNVHDHFQLGARAADRR